MGSKETFGTIIKCVFLFAYAAFLLSSINHIAYFFHSFEQVNSTDWTQWIGPYSLAAAIDVTGFFLVLGVMFFKAGMHPAVQGFLWFFILCITGLSWLINWEYAQQFASTDLSVPAKATLDLFFFQVKVGDINPIIASSFAFLNLAYSIVSEAFNSKPKTAAQLEQEAAELEKLQEAKGKIRKVKSSEREAIIESGLGLFKQVKKGVQEAVKNEEQNTVENTDRTTDELQSPNTDEMQLINIGNDPQNAVEDDEDEQESAVAIMSGKVPASSRPASVASVTIAEAALQLGISESYVRDLKSRKKLRSPSRSKSRILVSSIETYAMTRRKPAQKEEENTQENIIDMTGMKQHTFSTRDDIYTRDFVATNGD